MEISERRGRNRLVNATCVNRGMYFRGFPVGLRTGRRSVVKAHGCMDIDRNLKRNGKRRK